MSDVNFLWLYFKEYGDKTALAFNGNVYSYTWLYMKIQRLKEQLISRNLKNRVVAFNGDYTPDTIALFFSLIELKNVAVPLSANDEHDQSSCMDIAQIQFVVNLSEQGELNLIDLNRDITNEMLIDFMKLDKGGLVLFSSGTTGTPKAILHDFERLLLQYKERKKGFITISFLLMDHIGGIKTILHQLAGGGTLVLTNNKSTSNICHLIEKYKVNLLPVTPTFLNILLMSEDYKKYDLGSLKIVSYGTEVMPETTLRRFHEIFPDIALKQTYGLTEVGILSSKSENSSSKWVKLGGAGYQLKVVDGILWTKTQFSMVGYLNAPSPFDKDGWFNTMDMVETNGKYFKILGRKSDIINVGGLKVFPQEVENVLLQLPEVEEVTVSGVSHAIMGNIVVARIKPSNADINVSDLKKIIQQSCKGKLPNYKIPVKISLAENDFFNHRFKKTRCERIGSDEFYAN